MTAASRLLPPAWTVPCPATGSGSPRTAGWRSDLKAALRGVDLCIEPIGAPNPLANRICMSGGARRPSDVRRLFARDGRDVLHTITDAGERELSVSSVGRRRRAVRFRTWTDPDARLPIDPDHSSPKAALDGAMAMAALMRAHLDACVAAILADDDGTTTTLDAVASRCRAVGAVVAAECGDRVRVDAATPWTPLRAIAVDHRGAPTSHADLLGSARAAAWACTPIVSTRLDADGDPLILIVNPIRILVGPSTAMDALHAASTLP